MTVEFAKGQKVKALYAEDGHYYAATYLKPVGKKHRVLWEDGEYEENVTAVKAIPVKGKVIGKPAPAAKPSKPAAPKVTLPKKEVGTPLTKDQARAMAKNPESIDNGYEHGEELKRGQLVIVPDMDERWPPQKFVIAAITSVKATFTGDDAVRVTDKKYSWRTTSQYVMK